MWGIVREVLECSAEANSGHGSRRRGASGQLGFREYWTLVSYWRNQSSLQKYQPHSFQVCLLPQTVQEEAQLTLQGEREMVENQCDLFILAPTALLRMLPRAIFNTYLKTKILKIQQSLTVSNNHNSAGYKISRLIALPQREALQCQLGTTSKVRDTGNISWAVITFSVVPI